MENAPDAIEVEELSDLLKGDKPPVVLDVREDKELAICRMPTITHIPMGSLPERVGELPKDRLIVVHCHHGGRSARACAWLRQNGYTNVSNLTGGIDAWAARIDTAMEQY
ncbi:MAG: sulfurtransferase [Alphaproteobacteria bacterium]|nr:sulfurtransferase [Alphaproteobacteria bacterium]